MVGKTVYWYGEELRPAREGRVWLMQIYPGGRMQITQQRPGMASTPVAAIRDLRKGNMVYINLGDAQSVLAQWKVAK